MTDTPPFILKDTTDDDLRTLIINQPMESILQHVLHSDHSEFHTRYNNDVDVALTTETGLKTAKFYPHNGDTSDKDFDDYFSGSPPEDPEPHDKTGVTIVNHDDPELVNETAELIIELARELNTND